MGMGHNFKLRRRRSYPVVRGRGQGGLPVGFLTGYRLRLSNHVRRAHQIQAAVGLTGVVFIDEHVIQPSYCGPIQKSTTYNLSSSQSLSQLFSELPVSFDC